MHVSGIVGRSSLKELPVVLQLERHGIVHDAVQTVNRSGVAPEHRGEGAFMGAEHSVIAHRRPLLIFPADVAHADLVRP